MNASVKTRNAGHRRAPRSKAALYLSSDAKKSRDDIRLGSATVKALKLREARRVTVRGVVPGTTPAGTYRLLGCADDARKVKERNERNNCRAARRKLTVTAAGGTGHAGGPVSGGAAGPVGTGGAPGGEGGPASAGDGRPVVDPAGDDDGDGYANAGDCAPS